MNPYDEMITRMEEAESTIWTRELWHKAMDENNLSKLPTTPEQVEWFEEWYELHPEDQAKINKIIAESHERHAADFIVFKILFSSFLEDANREVFIMNWDKETKTCRVINPMNRDREYLIKL